MFCAFAAPLTLRLEDDDDDDDELEMAAVDVLESMSSPCPITIGWDNKDKINFDITLYDSFESINLIFRRLIGDCDEIWI